MPVSIIIYYDGAHIDHNDALGAPPFLETVSFIHMTSRHILSNWRIQGYVPKLDDEQGWSCTMDATVKEREHPKI